MNGFTIVRLQTGEVGEEGDGGEIKRVGEGRKMKEDRRERIEGLKLYENHIRYYPFHREISNGKVKERPFATDPP